MKLFLALVLIMVSSCPLTYGQRPTKKEISPIRRGQMSLPDAIDSVRPAIVQILARLHVRQNDGSIVSGNMVPAGSAFFVSRGGFVITARHVLHPNFRPPIDHLELFVGLPYPNSTGPNESTAFGNFEVAPFETLEEDKDHDLALLHLNGKSTTSFTMNGKKQVPLTNFPLSLSSSTPRDGLFIAVSGYPLSTSVLVTNAGYLASAWPLHPGTTEQSKSLFTYVGDIRANRGNSGGPVYSVTTGEVIGVFVSINNAAVEVSSGTGLTEEYQVDGKNLVYNSGLINIIPSRYVVDLMAKHNVKPER